MTRIRKRGASFAMHCNTGVFALCTALLAGCGEEGFTFELNDNSFNENSNGDSSNNNGNSSMNSNSNDNQNANENNSNDNTTPVERCVRPGTDGSAPRAIVVSKPQSESGDPAALYEVYRLIDDGSISGPEDSFTMGRSVFEEIVFTPDRELGIAPQQDGTLGLFEIDGNLDVTVIDPSFDANEAIDRLAMHPEGSFAYGIEFQGSLDPTVLNSRVQSIRISCDEELADEGALLRGNSITQMAFIPGRTDRFLIAALQMEGGPESGQHLYLYSLSGDGLSATLLDSTALWSDEDSMASDIALSSDGRFAVVTDDGLFAPNGGRLAYAQIDLVNDTVSAVDDVDTGLADDAARAPSAVVFAPDDSAAFLVNTDEAEAYRTIDFDPMDTEDPFTIGAQITYVHPTPILPDVAAGVVVGDSSGTVIVGELSAIRVLRFDGAGGINDLTQFSLGTGSLSVIGSLGVQP